jgi:hypothetical protein
MRAATRHIDLGIAISGATLAPGKIRTREEIAAYAGCTKQNIEQLEHRALRKLRHEIFYGRLRGLLEMDDLPAIIGGLPGGFHEHKTHTPRLQ